MVSVGAVVRRFVGVLVRARSVGSVVRVGGVGVKEARSARVMGGRSARVVGVPTVKVMSQRCSSWQGSSGAVVEVDGESGVSGESIVGEPSVVVVSGLSSGVVIVPAVTSTLEPEFDTSQEVHAS
jgi:hypothetical protein